LLRHYSSPIKAVSRLYTRILVTQYHNLEIFNALIAVSLSLPLSLFLQHILLQVYYTFTTCFTCVTVIPEIFNALITSFESSVPDWERERERDRKRGRERERKGGGERKRVEEGQ
jgi:hypothetical protein